MSEPSADETYLGDGLYCRVDSNDGSFWLRAPRGHEDHVVCLEPEVMLNFLRFIAKKEPTLLRNIVGRLNLAAEKI